MCLWVCVCVCVWVTVAITTQLYITRHVVLCLRGCASDPDAYLSVISAYMCFHSRPTKRFQFLTAYLCPLRARVCVCVCAHNYN